MEHILGNNFLKMKLRKCSKNLKPTKSCFNPHHQNEVRIMSNNRNNFFFDNLSFIDDNAILRKDLQLIFHEHLEDLTYLSIKNDNDFILRSKESTNKIISNKKYLKTYAGSTGDKTNNTEVEDSKVNNIIDIKCTQRTLEENKVNDELKHTNEVIVPNQNELNTKPQNSVVFTNDVKSDLQSLIIMMTISNKCNDSDDNQEMLKNEYVTTSHNINLNALVNISPVEENNLKTNVLKIDGIKIGTRKENLLRKYANKWMDFVKKERGKNVECQRLASINKFIDRLEKKKLSLNIPAAAANNAKLQARDYNTYQHRYKVQKHIIALQKAKLEQQNRLIDELKYDKIIEMTRQSLDNMKEDVRQTYYEIDKHLKPKIKCLTNELKIREIEDNSLILHCLKVPQFLQRMEARAREREEKHAIIRERRKQMEEDRVRLKQQAEIAKAEMDKEEKLKRMKELREKRKREKIENIRKKQHTERMRALIVMADLYYEKSLMAKYGIRPLKLLIQIKYDSIEKAKAHYKFQLKKNIFLHWMWHAEDMWYERNYKAEDFNRKKLLTKAFNSLKKQHCEYLTKMQVAKDYYDFYVTQFVFKKFQEGVMVIRNEYNNKWSNAIVYYNSNLLFKAITCWRTLPALNALKREQDARKQRWRQKVLQVVPDYAPPEE